MAKKREADRAAGKGSFADRLRRRRELLEAGDVQGAAEVMRKKDNQSTDSNNR